MKQINNQDIDALRQSIILQHDLFLQNVLMQKKVLRSDRNQMLQRLQHVNTKMNQLPPLAKASVSQRLVYKDLFLELQQLLQYFASPTSRPLDKRGAEYVPHYMLTMQLMFRIDRSLILYVEMIRTELALLEYRIQLGEEIGDCLQNLKETIALRQLSREFTDKKDTLYSDLGHYLRLIIEVLTPLLQNESNPTLFGQIRQLCLDIAGAYAQFDCIPPKADHTFWEPFLFVISMPAASKQEAQQCLCVGTWLQRCPLQLQQKTQLHSYLTAIREVIRNA